MSFSTLVTHRLQCTDDLPVYDSKAYQYLIAANGVFVRTETRFFSTIVPVARGEIRGLVPLQFQFRLRVPRIPASLLRTAVDDARNVRRDRGHLNEVLYYFHHHGQSVELCRPRQRSTATSVTAAGDGAPTLICELHSHGNMLAFWSGTDDADEQGARLYAVIGRLDDRPEIRLRVGVYGYHHPLPVSALFAGPTGLVDLHDKEQIS